jgi:hypothetical protein
VVSLSKQAVFGGQVGEDDVRAVRARLRDRIIPCQFNLTFS